MPAASPRFPLNATSGVTAISDTNSHTVFSAQTVTEPTWTRNLRVYLTDLILSNSSATATIVSILDGTTVIASFNVAASSGPLAINLSTPISGSQNTAMNIKCVTTSSGIVWTASGYAAT
jgi:hypothetical protein